MRLRAYELGDIDRVAARADFVADRRAAGCITPAGQKYSLLNAADQLVGVAGFMPIEGGGGQAVGMWAYLQELSPREWVKAARKTRAACEWWRAFNPRGRIYATPADTDAARRMLAYIGFRPSPDDAGVWKYMPEGR